MIDPADSCSHEGPTSRRMQRWARYDGLHGKKLVNSCSSILLAMASDLIIAMGSNLSDQAEARAARRWNMRWVKRASFGALGWKWSRNASKRSQTDLTSNLFKDEVPGKMIKGCKAMQGCERMGLGRFKRTE